MNLTSKLIAFCMIAVALVSCDNDDDPKKTTDTKGNLLFVSMLPNPDGQSGSSYMQLIDGLDPASYDNKAALPVPFGTAPIVIDNDVYVLPGWTEETNALKKYTRNNGKLTLSKELVFPASSGATHLVANGEKLYVSLAKRGMIYVLNRSTLAKEKEIDLSKYGVGDDNPDPACMIVRDNLLFVGLNQMVGGYYPAINRPVADVLIIDTKNNEVVKMISEKTSGISQATRPVDPQSIFMDENKDIYIVCLGAFGAHPTHNAGILRIKNGETEFDKDYSLVVNKTEISGETHKANVLWMVQYVANGKMYATANIPAYHSNPPSFLKDRTVLAVEIDLKEKTIKNLEIPKSNSFGMSVGLYDNKVLFGLATSSDNGFYTYDMASKQKSASAIVKTTGYPSAIRSFKK
ncbi:hypothetical protein EMN47_16460 [Prolixibacteraceae bacterium JC049]|nr:hypothetical protein [Prolixibacteraceae bacterium JC049]